MLSKNIDIIARILVYSGVFLFTNGICFAQDIITNDSSKVLYVKIKKINKDFIYYDSVGSNKPFRDSIERTHVLSYVKDVFPVEKEPNYNCEVFRISFGFGWSKILFKPENYDDASIFEKPVIDELYSGTDINLSASFFSSENFGLGVKYSRYASSYSETNTDFVMSSVGPLLTLRVYDNNNKNAFFISAGGLKVYTNETTGDFVAKNDTWIGSVDFSGDIKLDNHFYLQIFSSLVFGYLDAANTEIYRSGQLINTISFESTDDPITRFTIGAGLVIALN